MFSLKTATVAFLLLGCPWLAVVNCCNELLFTNIIFKKNLKNDYKIDKRLSVWLQGSKLLFTTGVISWMK